MNSIRTSRNEPCPCGSGKKYKKCCYGKGYEFEENEKGTIRRVVPMDDQLSDLLQKQIDGLGEEAKNNPESLLFPDMNQEHVEFEMTQIMEKAGIDPAIIFAFQETGLMISEENMDQFSQRDLDLWQSKIEEYRNDQGGSPGNEKFPMGTIVLYGPNDQTTTKIAAAVILHSSAEPIMERFVGSNIVDDPKVHEKIKIFFASHGVKSVIHSGGNLGCPHEEGEDFPLGEDCPFCPFWKGKQGSNEEY